MASSSRFGFPGPTKSVHWRAIRQGLLCFSAASLLFLNAWIELVPGMSLQYFSDYSPSWHALGALWVNLLALTGIFFAAKHCLAPRFWANRVTLLAGVVVMASLPHPFRQISIPFPPLFDAVAVKQSLGPTTFYSAVLGLALLLMGILVFAPGTARRLMQGVITVLVPLPFLLSLTIMRGIPAPKKPAAKLAKQHQDSPKRPLRVLVLVFDEWDYEYTFTRRPPHIRLPEIDRFAAEYTTFTHCWPPAGETMWSIPCLYTGTLWLGSVPSTAGDVLLKNPTTQTWQPWSRTPDLFTTLGKAGWNSSLIQWWQVYGPAYRERRPGLEISHYDADLLWGKTREEYATFSGSLLRQAASIGRSYRSYFRFFWPRNVIPDRVEIAKNMRLEILAQILDQRRDLLWAHVPFPHSPAFIRASNGRYLDHPDPSVSNLENMILVDQTMAEVRRALESTQSWNQTLVIFTSDHWQRDHTGDHLPASLEKTRSELGLRVPLLVKFPDQNTPAQVDQRFSNIVLSHWIEALTEGRTITLKESLEAPPTLPPNLRNFLVNRHN